MNDFKSTGGSGDVAFTFFFIENGVTQHRIIPRELKDSILEHFGSDVRELTSIEVDDFINSNT